MESFFFNLPLLIIKESPHFLRMGVVTYCEVLRSEVTWSSERQAGIDTVNTSRWRHDNTWYIQCKNPDVQWSDGFNIRYVLRQHHSYVSTVSSG